jgi:hypothetical protein
MSLFLVLPSPKSSMCGRLPVRSRRRSLLPLAGSTLSVQVRALNSWRCAIILRAPESFEIRGHDRLFFGLEFGPEASHESVASGHDEVALDLELRHAQTVDRVGFVQIRKAVVSVWDGSSAWDEEPDRDKEPDWNESPFGMRS